MNDFKSNSHKSKSIENKPKIERVVSGKVQVKKKNELQKMADIFISEDVDSVKNYIFIDVLVPAIKKAVSDIVTNGIDMLLYGETGRTKKSTTSSKVSYTNYNVRPNERQTQPNNRRGSYGYEDVIIDNKCEAEEVLNTMDDIIDNYGIVSVADFNELVGVSGKFTDNNYGWSDLKTATVIRVRDGWVIKLPRAIVL